MSNENIPSGTAVIERGERVCKTAKLANGEAALLNCVYRGEDGQGGARITGDGTLQHPLKVILTPEQAAAPVLRQALRAFAHPDLSAGIHGGAINPEQPIYGRDKAVLKLGDFQTAAAILRSLDTIDEVVGRGRVAIGDDLPKFGFVMLPGHDSAGRDYVCNFHALGVSVYSADREDAIAKAEAMALFLATSPAFAK
jgi:hypothetical protein